MEDDLPEMALEMPEEIEEIQEFAAVEEEEEESVEADMGELGLIEEESAEAPLAEIPAATDDDDLSDLGLAMPEEVEEFAATEEEALAEDELGEMELMEEEVPVADAAALPPQGEFEPDPSWLDETALAELPPTGDLPVDDEAPTALAETLSEESLEDLEAEPAAPEVTGETPTAILNEEPELDWLDDGIQEPPAPSLDDAAGEPSLEELGLDQADPDRVDRVRTDMPTATHEFTSVDPLEATEDDLTWEHAESPSSDVAAEGFETEEPLEFEETPPSFAETADEANEEEIAAEGAEELSEEIEEEIAAELPPAAPWQTTHEETSAWAPSTEEPPPFSLQAEPERPAFFADTAPQAASAKSPQPAKKKKGWSLFGWLKKKGKSRFSPLLRPRLLPLSPLRLNRHSAKRNLRPGPASRRPRSNRRLSSHRDLLRPKLKRHSICQKSSFPSRNSPNCKRTAWSRVWSFRLPMKPELRPPRSSPNGTNSAWTKPKSRQLSPPRPIWNLMRLKSLRKRSTSVRRSPI